MAPLRRNGATSKHRGTKPRNSARSSDSCAFVEGHRDSISPTVKAKNRFAGRPKRKMAAASKVNGNLENLVSQDPKLNGKLIPTVPLEKSAHTTNPVQRANSLRRTKARCLRPNRTASERALRTKNPVLEPAPLSNDPGNLKSHKPLKVERVRVESRESLDCLNMLAPVFADCKLNGGSAPRVVLKRLDLKQFLQNGISSVEPDRTEQKQRNPSNHDLNSRGKPRSRLKTIISPRSQRGKRNLGNIGRRRRGSQRFQPVPCHEKKWWNSFPLKQVAVRLTKLPLENDE